MPWDKIKGLWTEWEPTQAEAALWRSELSKYDPELARRAVKALYKVAGRFKRPDWQRFEQAIRELKQQTKEPTNTEFFYIAFICSEDGQMRAGYYEQFCWVAKWDKVVMAYQVPTQEHLAKRCQDYQNRFKGRWINMMTKHYPDVRRKARQFKRSTV